jgi:hypothetical protein
MRTVTYTIEERDYEEHGIVFFLVENETRHLSPEGRDVTYRYEVACFATRAEAEACRADLYGVDEMPHYRTYVDNSGIEHESYEAACHYYGCDTPAQAEEEARYMQQEAWIEQQDEMEARGGPVFSSPDYFDHDMPF